MKHNKSLNNLQNVIKSFKNEFKSFPKKLDRSIVTINKSESIVSSLHSIYLELQSKRITGKGLTEKESDILRAMLVFSASGLDSVVKQLIRDTLLEITRKNDNVQKQLEKFIEKKLKTKDSEGSDIVDIKNLANVLATPSPFERIVGIEKKELTSGSLQSKDELLRIASIFAIEPKEICDDVEQLKDAFIIRNQIIHEMDINFESTSNRRTPRNNKEMCFYSNLLLKVGSNFIKAVKIKLEN